MTKMLFLFVCISFVMFVVGMTPEEENFYLAVFRKDIGDVKNLIDKVNVNMQDYRGRTALLNATNQDDFEMIKFLLEKGADPSVPNIVYDTPISIAIEKEKLDILKLLITSKNINQELPGSLINKTPLILGSVNKFEN